jgi:voltage-gated potassium channel
MRTDDADTGHYRLRRHSRTPTWLALSWRALVAVGLIGIALAVHWFDRGGLRQNSGVPVTFADILYFTMITVTTVGYGDIVPVTQQARMFDTSSSRRSGCSYGSSFWERRMISYSRASGRNGVCR